MSRARTITMKATRHGTLALLLAVAAGCSEVSLGPPGQSASFATYVAMGTSISMGVAGDGVVAESQQSSWPRQLADLLGATFTQPLISSPGCRPPLAAPLGQFRRADGSPALSPFTCSTNAAGVTLPTQNLAIAGATAQSAINATPASATTPLTSRVLAAGQTQATAMRALNPTFVSVEYGANEILPALNGIATEGVTLTPFPTFRSNYSTIMDHVRQSGARAVLVMLPADLRLFPSLRGSLEIAAQRTAFAARNINVSEDCNGSPNFIVVPTKVLSAVLAASVLAGAGLGPLEFSCEDVPGTADGVLTDADLNAINALVTQMNGLIATRAHDENYAIFSLSALYDPVKTNQPFDLEALLTSANPFGPNIGLDGVHPSPAGHAILAAAARTVIEIKYGAVR